MTRPRPTVPHGFTLIELMVSMGISVIVIGGGVALLLSQQRMFKNSSADRAVQEMARVTLGEMSARIRMAGFGVDPTVALDFGPTAQARMPAVPRVPSGVRPRNFPGYECDEGVVRCRDRTDRPDEIVFYSRSPRFRHNLLAMSGTSGITISGPLNVPLFPGQILQLMCIGEMKWAYVTVDRFVPASATPDPIPVAIRAPLGQELDFPTQNGAMLTDGLRNCVGNANGLVTKVDRYRYFIGTYDDLGVEQGWQAAGMRPALMLDQGLLDASGQPILTVVAPDVEDLQLAYLFPGGGAQLVGAAALLPIAVGAAGIDPLAVSAGYDIPTPVDRSTQHPGNIRGVRIAIVVRTRVPDRSTADPTNQTIPASFNRDALPGEPGFRRTRFETTVDLPNLDSRYPYFPTTSVDPKLNVGGG